MKLMTEYHSTPQLWHAYDADRYDGASDAGPQMVGEGKTELEAIKDFCEKLSDKVDDLEDVEKYTRSLVRLIQRTKDTMANMPDSLDIVGDRINGDLAADVLVELKAALAHPLAKDYTK